MIELELLDWIIIVVFILLIIGISVTYTQSAGKNLSSFFLGGRNLPWWIAGTSMVATTFAADTPLLITEIVANDGISGNWLWWNGLIGGMLATFFFAKFWRKAEIITDVELIELRYSGAPARFLRGLKAIYLGVFMNAIVIAWVNIALGALLQEFFGIPDNQLIFYYLGAMGFVVLYSSLSGLKGVAITDFLQFTLAMIGTIVLAIIVVNSEQIGGITGLKAKLPADTFNFFPRVSFGSQSVSESAEFLTLSFGSFLAFVGFQWWSSWYPGAEPGGGGYVAQRMMSTKKPQDAVKATLLFQIAHYAIRPLPWILVGLSAIYLYPDLAPEDKKLGYVMAMKDFLPVGLKGLLLVTFFAAYASTISTQLNWGAGYLVNDLYKRFINPTANQKRLVLFSRLGTILTALIAWVVTSQIQTLEQAFKFMIEAGAGVGAVLILRWYWWRVNAWSEIVATIFPLFIYAFIKFVLEWEFPDSFFLTLTLSSIAWVVITFLTPPTSQEVLQNFYKKIQPDGFWKPIRTSLNLSHRKSNIPNLLMAWLSATIMGYSTLFLVGEMVFMEWEMAGVYAFILAFSLISLNYYAKKVNIFGD